MMRIVGIFVALLAGVNDAVAVPKGRPRVQHNTRLFAAMGQADRIRSDRR
jgi:hypothetical protein